MTFRILVDKGAFQRAIEAVKLVAAAKSEEDEIISKLPAVSAVYDGLKAVEARNAEIEAIKAKTAQAAKRAIEIIDHCESDFNAEFDKKFAPHGDDFLGDGSGDYALLSNGLINTPEELVKLLERHKSSTAFRRLAESYANKRQQLEPSVDWNTLTHIGDSSAAILEFAKDFFRDCKTACNAPDGVTSRTLTAPNALEERAAAAHIAEFVQ